MVTKKPRSSRRAPRSKPGPEKHEHRPEHPKVSGRKISTARVKRKAAKREGPAVKHETSEDWLEELQASVPREGGDGPRAVVKHALRQFNYLRSRAIQTEAARIEEQRRERGLPSAGTKAGSAGTTRAVGKKYKAKKGDARKDEEKEGQGGKVKVPAQRPDLRALSQMKTAGLCVNQGKLEGHVPGVDVGDMFFCRAELCVVGLHDHWLSGIGFRGSKSDSRALSIALSIVISGGYEDDQDAGDEFWYTGQGGNDLCGTRRQIGDQKLHLGNEALKNSISIGNDVRVIRGNSSSSKNALVGRCYVYDGLHKVVDMQESMGKSNFRVFKFLLRRNEDQPPLSSEQVRFVNAKAPRTITDAEGVILQDLSGGAEKLPIVVTNIVDPPNLPPPFTYLTERRLCPELRSHGEQPLPGCNCRGECVESKCACAQYLSGQFAYVKGGRLIKNRGVVVECGPNCSCSSRQCGNRVAQHGLQFRLEVFKTPNKGWAVRSWDPIPAGAMVVEYMGEVIPDAHACVRHNDVYVLDIDTVRTAKHGTAGREAMASDLALLLDKEEEGEEEVQWSVDGASCGNVSRFINHSCSPNLFYQSVLWDDRRPHVSHLVLCAAENIPPMKELTYDYGYEVGTVTDAHGSRKSMNCYCGAENCRKQLY